jgi:hypothetical protein
VARQRPPHLSRVVAKISARIGAGGSLAAKLRLPRPLEVNVTVAKLSGQAVECGLRFSFAASGSDPVACLVE